MNAAERWELCRGSPPWTAPDRAALSADPSVWEGAWKLGREQALASWVDSHPGTRPPAWHRFDTPARRRRKAGEFEASWLYRLGEIDQTELATIAANVRELARFNEGRHPADVVSNFIPPGELAEFARTRDLLTSGEVEILWPTKALESKARPESPTLAVDAAQSRQDRSIEPKPASGATVKPTNLEQPRRPLVSVPYQERDLVSEIIQAFNPPPAPKPKPVPELPWVDPAWEAFIQRLTEAEACQM